MFLFRFSLATAVILGALLQAQDAANPATALPTDDGVFYKSPTGLKQLQPVQMSGGGAKHIGKMFVPGLTPQMVWTFRGAEAPVLVSDKRPVFYWKELPAVANIAGRTSRDIILVRFDKKKDHRELQVTSGGNMFTYKAGMSKDRAPDIAVTEISPGLFKVEPSQDLVPGGEYMLSMGAGVTSGFDFRTTKP